MRQYSTDFWTFLTWFHQISPNNEFFRRTTIIYIHILLSDLSDYKSVDKFPRSPADHWRSGSLFSLVFLKQELACFHCVCLSCHLSPFYYTCKILYIANNNNSKICAQWAMMTTKRPPNLTITIRHFSTMTLKTTF